MRRLLLLPVLVLVASPAEATTSGELLEPLFESLEGRSEVWMLQFRAWGLYLAGILALLQIVLFVVQRMLLSGAETSLLDALVGFGRRYVWMALCVSVLLGWPLFGPVLIQLFLEIAIDVTGLPALSPATLIDQGIGLATTIFSSQSLTMWTITGQIFHFILIVLLLTFAYVTMAIAVSRVLVESLLVVTLGPLFWATSLFEHTAAIAEGLVRAAVKVGVKLLLMYLMVDWLGGFGALWATDLEAMAWWNPGDQLGTLLNYAVAAVLISTLVSVLPGYFANQLVGSWSPPLRQALS
ncbi:MAG: type IV secretion system protein [Acidobacteriota bacterium]